MVDLFSSLLLKGSLNLWIKIRILLPYGLLLLILAIVSCELDSFSSRFLSAFFTFRTLAPKFDWTVLSISVRSH
jgi:hypothetical protein